MKITLPQDPTPFDLAWFRLAIKVGAAVHGYAPTIRVLPRQNRNPKGSSCAR